MSTDLWEAIDERDGRPIVARTETPIAEIVARCEAREPLAQIAASLGLEPREVVAALGRAGLGADDDGPALEQTSPRRPALLGALSDDALAGLFPTVARPARLGLAAGLLQIHDFWDASHNAAQQADDLGESTVSAYWHGIAHRREPDPGNASYWFRRVGRHPLFPGLAEAVRAVLDETPEGASIAARLNARGAWDPYAFIDLCVKARGQTAALARRLQRIEMKLLLSASIPDHAT